MQRDPLASTKARKAERKADEKSGLITIKPVTLEVQGGGTGFKKGGFKSAFGGGGGGNVKVKEEVAGKSRKAGVVGGVEEPLDAGVGGEELVESDTDDEYEYYDPRRPTDCWEGCSGRKV